MDSIWTLTEKVPDFGTLKGDFKTDVLIIGGGITGILCAYMLQNKGVDCVIVEAGRICGGTTKNTTAKITVQHGLIYDKIISKYGLESARLYFQAQRDALENYRKMCRNVECDFKECDSFVYSLDSRKNIENELNALSKIGCPGSFVDKPKLPFKTEGAVCIKSQAQFNPLKFLSSIAENLKIFENTRALEIRQGEVITDRGTINADKVIVATHFPFLNRHGAYFLKMYQHRSYVIALKNVPLINGMYIDESGKGLSFREYNGLLLLGGGSHRTGKKGGGWNELSDFAKRYYPKAEEVCRWATQDCMTLDGIPYIGQYSKNIPWLYVATGFNKWGMTSAMVSAMLLSDMTEGKKNAYTEVFSPQRSMLHPQLAVNMAESLVGMFTPTTPRCPHLGCALKYNKYEHSWDCACHGSRFTEEGKVIDNPANGDKNN